MGGDFFQGGGGVWGLAVISSLSEEGLNISNTHQCLYLCRNEPGVLGCKFGVKVENSLPLGKKFKVYSDVNLEPRGQEVSKSTIIKHKARQFVDN